MKKNITRTESGILRFPQEFNASTLSDFSCNFATDACFSATPFLHGTAHIVEESFDNLIGFRCAYCHSFFCELPVGLDGTVLCPRCGSGCFYNDSLLP